MNYNGLCYCLHDGLPGPAASRGQLELSLSNTVPRYTCLHNSLDHEAVWPLITTYELLALMQNCPLPVYSSLCWTAVYFANPINAATFYRSSKVVQRVCSTFCSATGPKCVGSKGCLFLYQLLLTYISFLCMVIRKHHIGVLNLLRYTMCMWCLQIATCQQVSSLYQIPSFFPPPSEKFDYRVCIIIGTIDIQSNTHFIPL